METKVVEVRSIPEAKVIPESLFCGICYEAFNVPSTLVCGHTFCLDHIERIKKPKDSLHEVKCPMCNDIKIYDKFIPSFTLLSLMEEFGVKPGQKLDRDQVVSLQEDGVFGFETKRALQLFLHSQGHSLAIDGDFDRTSSLEFQKYLDSNSIVPIQSWGLITKFHLQRYLKISKYDVGPIDGIFGGRTVVALQTFLAKELGRSIRLDGDFGPYTTFCLQEFLTKKGYVLGQPDGVLGKRTNDALCQFLGEQLPVTFGSLITNCACQNWLINRGFNPGPIDGMIGSRTIIALQKFLNSQRMSKSKLQD